MRFQPAGVTEDSINPIDLLEELVVANEWAFDRSSEHELVVETVGRWREDLDALYLTSALDTRVSDEKRTAVMELLCRVNEKTWLGHFDLSATDRLLFFRYTMLNRGFPAPTSEQLEDLVDIAVAECERFYPALQMVVWAGNTPEEAVASAMLETVGEA